jgi:putative hydrolase of the HAD superfamily
MGFSPSEIVVIGDSYGKDMVPAKKVGCKAIWLSGPAWAKEEIDPDLPDLTIHSLDEVLGYLL